MNSEKFRSLPALIVYWTLLTITAMAPYLFLNALIVPSADAINYYYPAFFWYAEALRQGTSFLWDPSILSGFPLYLSQVGGFLEPLNILLFKFIPSFLVAYHLRLVIDYVLVMVFSYLAAREWQISKLAAFFIGPAYIMAFHWWYMGTILFPNSLFILPFIFWCYLRSVKALNLSRQLLWGAIAGVGIGWAFLGGYAQFVIYSLTFLGLYAIYDFFVLTETSKRTIRLCATRIATLAIMALVGAGVGAPQIVASISHVPFSVRSGGVTYAETQLKVLNAKEPIYFFFPDYLRFPFLNGGKKSLFIGVMSLLLAIVAVLHFRRNKVIAILAGLFFFALILAIPGSPVYWLLHQVPVFDLFRYPHRFLYDGIWMLAVLGAIGFDMMRERLHDRSSKVVAIIASILAAGLSVFVIACTFFSEWFWGPIKQIGFWLFVNLVYSPESFVKGLVHYEGAFYRGIDAWRDVASLTNMPFAIPFYSLVGAATIFALRVFGRLSWRQFQVAAAVVFAGTFIGVFIARWPDTLPSSTLQLHERSLGELIPESDKLMYRVQPFHNGFGFQPRHSTLIWNTEDVNAGVELQHASAVPNNHRYAHLRLTDGYEPFISGDLQRVLSLLGSNYSSEELVKGIPIEERKERLYANLDVLGMMSGKYIITGVSLTHPDLVLQGTTTGSAYDTPINVYKYSKALPRVYLAKHTESLPHTTVMELVENNKRFLNTTYLDCESCSEGTALRGSTFEIIQSKNGYFDIIVEAKGIQWLIVSEQLLPGWKVELDGEPVDVIRANGMYMGIKVPSGSHRITLEYEGILGEARLLKKIGLHPDYSFQ